MRHWEITAVTAFALLVGPAMAGAAETFAWHSASYAYKQFAVAAAGRDTPVYVQGNPFDTDRRSLERSVIDAVQRAVHYAPTRFTTRPTADSVRVFKVIFLFNGPPTVTATALCGAHRRFRAAPNRPRLDVFAVLCRGGSPVSSVTVSTTDVVVPDDAKFAHLIGQVAQALLPRIEPNAAENRRPVAPEPTLEGTR